MFFPRRRRRLVLELLDGIVILGLHVIDLLLTVRRRRLVLLFRRREARLDRIDGLLHLRWLVS